MLDRVIAMRLATQRLTSAPLARAEDAVGLLLAVQSQDAPLARWSLAMRSRDATDSDVIAAFDAGRIVRTHVLRPTWHNVLAEDLRWLQDLTGGKVAAGLRARHRQLRLDEPREVERGHAAVADRLRRGRHLTRRELAAELDDPGLTGERLGHLLMLAELDGLICGGPLRRGLHTYALADEWLPPTAPKPRDEAIRELVRRFFAGHGPASVAHLVRWSTLTGAEVEQALAELGDELDTIDLHGTPHWFDPATRARARRRLHAFLLPVFDEAYLPYPRSMVPRAPAHPSAVEPHSFSESGGGLVVCDGRDAGWWKRRRVRDTTEVTVALSAALTGEQEHRITEQAAALADFTGSRLRLTLLRDGG